MRQVRSYPFICAYGHVSVNECMQDLRLLFEDASVHTCQIIQQHPAPQTQLYWCQRASKSARGPLREMATGAASLAPSPPNVCMKGPQATSMTGQRGAKETFAPMLAETSALLRRLSHLHTAERGVSNTGQPKQTVRSEKTSETWAV